MADSSSRWSAIAAFALVGAASQVLWLTFAGVTTVSAKHYGVSETAIGWLAQVFPLLYVVLAIPAGLILDRWFNVGLAAGAVLTAVGAAVRLVGDDFTTVLIGQILVAIAQPLVLNAITGITGRYLVEKDRPAGIAVGTASTFGGMVLAFVLAAALPNDDQLRLVMAIGAVFAIVAAAYLLVALRTPGQQRHVSPPAGLGALRIAWNDRLIRRLCVLVFFPFGTFVALTTFAQAMLEPAGVDADTASLILLVNVVAGVIGCAVLPIAAAKRNKELALIGAGSIATAVSCAALAVAPGVAVGLIAMVVIGFVLLPALPIVLELVERRTGEAAGTGAGLIWMSGNLGGLVVAMIVGVLVDRPATGFGVCAVVALGALLVVPLIRPQLVELSKSRELVGSDS